MFLLFQGGVVCASDTIPAPGALWQDYETAQADSALPDVPDDDRFLISADPFIPADGNGIAEKQAPSALEDFYRGRILEDLEQFGYNQFGGVDALKGPQIPAGAVQDDFILGTGDVLQITFAGQRSDQAEYTIPPQGTITIRDFPPVAAAGRSIKDVRAALETQVAQRHNTQVYVSLTSVRQIGVLVVGDVAAPGLKSLSAFHTVIDALMQSGGVRKTGSLRSIKLVRDGRSRIVDLYGLFMYGADGMDLNLRDGDRLIIPPIGPTVAVAGGVKRPGIYELRKTLRGMAVSDTNSEKLSLSAMLELGGGLLAPGQSRFMMLDLHKDGQETTTQVEDEFAALFGDGAILMVAKGKEKRAGMVELAGHTNRVGLHDLNRVKTLSTLLDDTHVLGPDIYPLIGVVEHWNTNQMAREYKAFPLRLVLKGEFDMSLQDGDVVNLFSNADIARLQDVKKKYEAHTDEGSVSEVDVIDNPDIAGFLREHAVYVRGAVRHEGLYPVAEGASLDTVLSAAGGLGIEADYSQIEVTSNAKGTGTKREIIDLNKTQPVEVSLRAGDTVRIGQKIRKIAKERTVLIAGEVMSPGYYDLMPGDKLSDLLTRAGGLSVQAYAPGTIFSRESERRAEEARYRAQAAEMERELAAAMQREKNPPNAEQIRAVRELAATLGNVQAVGRMTVEADPAMLKTHPEMDVLLESGDRIYIPKRPSTVRVSGEVLSPANLQFLSDKDPLDYIHEAGGFTFHADKDRAFVLYPDGSAQPLQVSVWNHNPVLIPPGSTIIVPRDPKPFDFIESAKDVSQILSNLAITAIFVDDVQD